MFRHYRVILRQPVINTVPSYTSISNAAVGNTVYNYHTATCFDTIVSSSDSLQSIPCQVTPVFQMQLLAIQFTVKMFHTGFIILYYDQQIHNYFTNYYTPTCFDSIVSSSGRL